MMAPPRPDFNQTEMEGRRYTGVVSEPDAALRPSQDDPHWRRVQDRRALGRTIRALRKRQGRTLANVAGEAGISVSLLSQVEHGVVDPSLDSLRDIADALGVPPFKLLAERPINRRIVRAGEGTPLALPDSDVELFLLSPSLEGPFEVVRWTLRAGGVTARHPRGHGGVEAMYILEGTVQIEVGDETVELRRGDFFTIEAQIPHRARAVGDWPASGIFVVSPPSF
jgi:transcriptional regulator with XRE-family HTH domain